jgi:competence protein ComEC
MDRRIGRVEVVTLALVTGQLASWEQGAAAVGIAALAGTAACLARLGRGRVRVARDLVGVLLAFAAGAALGALGQRIPTAADRVRQLGLPWRGLVEAVVVDGPWRAGGHERLVVDVVATRRSGRWSARRGRLALAAYRPVPELVPGTRFRARLSVRAPHAFRNPGSFDWVGHLARRGIHATASLSAGARVTVVEAGAKAWRGWIGRWRRSVADRIAVVAGGDARAVLLALVVGDRGEVSPALRARFVRAGVAHVLAISGLHVGIVAWLVVRIVTGLLVRREPVASRVDGRAVARLVACGPAALYCALGGLGPSVLRAGIALGVVAVAGVGDRRPDGLRVVALVAVTLTLLEPGLARDVGCQLSLAAVVGLLLADDGRGGLVRRALRASFGAWVATAPLLAHHFQEISLSGPIVAPLLLPFFGIGPIASGVLGAMLEPAGTSLGDACLRSAAILLRPGLALVDLAAQLPGAHLAVARPSALETAGLYVVLAILASGRGRRRRALVAMALFAVLADVGWWVRLRTAPGRLVVTFLDVGQGDAAVVELPGGRVLVVDGGGFPGSAFDVGRAVVAPYLRARKIGHVEVVVATHTHPDHFGGLATVVEGFHPREVWWPGGGGAEEGWRRLVAAAGAAGTRLRVVEAGRVMRLGGATIRVVHPPPGFRGSVNESSVVLEIGWAGRRILLTGDVEAGAEEAILASQALGGPAAVVKVPHHGSRTSSTAAFVRATAPALAVVSVGAANRYGHPAPEVEARWRAAGACVLRTDACGAITVTVGRRGDVAVATVDPSCACPAASGRRGDPLLEGVHHEADPVAHAELVEDVGEVRLHRALADAELTRDLLVLVAGGHEPDDLELPVGQPEGVALRRTLRRRWQGRDVVLEQLGHPRVHPALPAADGADGLHEGVPRRVLEDHRPGAEMERAQVLLGVVRGGQHEHARVRADLHHGRDRVEPAPGRHADVEHEHVGSGLPDQLDDVVGAVDVRDDLQPLLGVQHRPEPLAEERVVVDQYEPKRLCHLSTIPSRRGAHLDRPLRAGAVRHGQG